MSGPLFDEKDDDSSTRIKSLCTDVSRLQESYDAGARLLSSAVYHRDRTISALTCENARLNNDAADAEHRIAQLKSAVIHIAQLRDAEDEMHNDIRARNEADKTKLNEHIAKINAELTHTRAQYEVASASASECERLRAAVAESASAVNELNIRIADSTQRRQRDAQLYRETLDALRAQVSEQRARCERADADCAELEKRNTQCADALTVERDNAAITSAEAQRLREELIVTRMNESRRADDCDRIQRELASAYAAAEVTAAEVSHIKIELQRSAESYANERATAETEFRAVSSELSSARIRLSAADSAVAVLTEKCSALNTLQMRCAHLETVEMTLRSDVTRFSAHEDASAATIAALHKQIADSALKVADVERRERELRGDLESERIAASVAQERHTAALATATSLHVGAMSTATSALSRERMRSEALQHEIACAADAASKLKALADTKQSDANAFAQENTELSTIISALKTDIESANATANRHRTVAQDSSARVQVLSARLQDNQVSYNAVDAELINARLRCDDLSAALNDYVGECALRSDQIDHLTQRAHDANKQITSAHAHIDELNAAAHRTSIAYDAVCEERRLLSSQYSAAAEALANALTANEQAAADITQLNADVVQLRVQYAAALSERDLSASEVVHLGQRLTSADAEIREVKEKHSECALTIASLTATTATLNADADRRTAEFADLTRQICDLSAECSSTETSYLNAESSRRETETVLLSVRDELRTSQELVSQLTTALDTSTAERSSLQAFVDVTLSERYRVEGEYNAAVASHAAEVSRMKNDADGLSGVIASSAERIRSLEFALDSQRNAVAALTSRCESASAECVSLQTRLDSTESALNGARSDIRLIEEKRCAESDRYAIDIQLARDEVAALQQQISRDAAEYESAIATANRRRKRKSTRQANDQIAAESVSESWKAKCRELSAVVTSERQEIAGLVAIRDRLYHQAKESFHSATALTSELRRVNDLLESERRAAADVRAQFERVCSRHEQQLADVTKELASRQSAVDSLTAENARLELSADKLADQFKAMTSAQHPLIMSAPPFITPQMALTHMLPSAAAGAFFYPNAQYSPPTTLSDVERRNDDRIYRLTNDLDNAERTRRHEIDSLYDAVRRERIDSAVNRIDDKITQTQYRSRSRSRRRSIGELEAALSLSDTRRRLEAAETECRQLRGTVDAVKTESAREATTAAEKLSAISSATTAEIQRLSRAVDAAEKTESDLLEELTHLKARIKAAESQLRDESERALQLRQCEAESARAQLQSAEDRHRRELTEFTAERRVLNERLVSAAAERERIAYELSAVRSARMNDTSEVVVAMSIDNAVMSIRCDEQTAEIDRLRRRIDELNAAEWTATEITHITAARTPRSDNQQIQRRRGDGGGDSRTRANNTNIRRNEDDRERDGRSDDNTSDNDDDDGDGDGDGDGEDDDFTSAEVVSVDAEVSALELERARRYAAESEVVALMAERASSVERALSDPPSPSSSSASTFDQMNSLRTENARLRGEVESLRAAVGGAMDVTAVSTEAAIEYHSGTDRIVSSMSATVDRLTADHERLRAEYERARLDAADAEGATAAIQLKLNRLSEQYSRLRNEQGAAQRRIASVSEGPSTPPQIIGELESALTALKASRDDLGRVESELTESRSALSAAALNAADLREMQSATASRLQEIEAEIASERRRMDGPTHSRLQPTSAPVSAPTTPMSSRSSAYGNHVDPTASIVGGNTRANAVSSTSVSTFRDGGVLAEVREQVAHQQSTIIRLQTELLQSRMNEMFLQSKVTAAERLYSPPQQNTAPVSVNNADAASVWADNAVLRRQMERLTSELASANAAAASASAAAVAARADVSDARRARALCEERLQSEMSELSVARSQTLSADRRAESLSAVIYHQTRLIENTPKPTANESDINADVVSLQARAIEHLLVHSAISTTASAVTEQTQTKQ